MGGGSPRTDGRTRRGRASREARRTQLKGSALQVFAARGYHETSVSDLVRAAGVARGTFYLYFDSKDALFLELLDDLVRHLRGNIVGVDTAPGAPPLVAQLEATVARILQTVVTNRPLTRIIFREAIGLHEAVEARLQDFDDELHAYVERSLASGVAEGLVRCPDPAVSAACVIGSLRELVLRRVVASDADFDLEQVASAVVAHHLHGLHPRG